MTEEVSWEIARDDPPGTNPKERVSAWLTSHKSEIVSAETRYRVDRRAIAGAIAWEALENPKSVTWLFLLPKWAGPGKVHYEEHWGFEGNPVAAQAEGMGLLKPLILGRLNAHGRRLLLEDSKISIEYIAAIMKGYVDAGKTAGHDLECLPDILATFYHGVKDKSDPKNWREVHLDIWPTETDKENAIDYLKKRPPGQLRPSPYPEMGGWVEQEILYLENAVGKPPDWLCTGSTPTGGLLFQGPVEGVITQKFSANHDGVDIAVGVRFQTGDPIYSASNGTVEAAGWENPNDHSQGFGVRILVRDGNGNLFTYGSLEEGSLRVAAGATVSAGDWIANEGSTGNSTGPHLGFRIHDSSDNPLDPFPIKLNGDSVSKGATYVAT